MKNESYSQTQPTHSGPQSDVQNEPESEALTSELAELLLYHAALGRGYNSPFPQTRGQVFTSALPEQAIEVFNAAEDRFRNWHVEHFNEMYEEFERMKNMHKSFLSAPENKERYMRLKEDALKLPMVTLKDHNASMAGFYRMLKNSYYGAVTFFDEGGFRLALMLCGRASKFPGEITLFLLTDGGIEYSMFSLRLTRGLSFPANNPPIFNFFSNARFDDTVHNLRDRIMNSIEGVPGIGHCVLLHGESKIFTGTSEDTLYDLMMQVYVRGKDDPAKRVKVTIDDESSADWQRFLNWTQADILDAEKLTDRERKALEKSPASPQLSALFGARAAMVKAFLTAAEGVGKTGPIQEIVLGAEDLGRAEKFAKLIYIKSSGLGLAKIRRKKVTRR